MNAWARFEGYSDRGELNLLPSFAPSWHPVSPSGGNILPLNIPAGFMNISFTDFEQQGSFAGLIYLKGDGGGFYFVKLDAGKITDVTTGKDITQSVSAVNWGGLALAGSPNGRGTLEAISAIGIDKFKASFDALSTAVGVDAVAQAFESDPAGFVSVLKDVSEMITDNKFQLAYSSLSGAVGQDAVAQAFKSDMMGFVYALRDVSGIVSENKFQSAYMALSGAMGQDTCVQAFKSDPQGFVLILGVTSDMDTVKFKSAYSSLSAAVGKDMVAQILKTKPGDLAIALKSVNDMTVSNFNTASSSLTSIVGKDASAQAFKSGPQDYISLVEAINNMGTADFNAAVGILTKDAFRQVFKANPGASAAVLRAIKGLGIDGLNKVTELLSRDAVIQVFSSNAAGFASALTAIKDLGVDNFNAVATFMTRDAAIQAFKTNAAGFADTLTAIKGLGMDGFDRVAGLVTKDALIQVFQAKSGDLAIALKNINNMGINEFAAAYASLSGIVGQDAATQAFGSDPAGMVYVAQVINDIGTVDFNAMSGLLNKDAIIHVLQVKPGAFAMFLKSIKNDIGIDNFKTISGLLTKDAVSGLFQSSPYDLVTVLGIIKGMDINKLKNAFPAVAAAVGQDAAVKALWLDPHGFLITLSAINAMGIDKFNAIVNPLKAEFGEKAVADLLVDNGYLMHLERFNPGDITEILKNRLENYPDGRPLAILVFTTYDYTGNQIADGAFALDKDVLFKSLIDHGYRVMYYEVSTEGQMISALKYASMDQKASLIIFSGHGDRTDLVLGNPSRINRNLQGNDGIPEDYILDMSDQKELFSAAVSNALVDNGTVILNSCGTGEGGNEKPNLARMMSDIYDQADFVFAPVAASNIESLTYQWFTNKVVNVAYWNHGPIATFNAAGYPLQPDDSK